MLIEQLIELKSKLRGPVPLGRTCAFKTGFHDKTKISKANNIRLIVYP